MPFNQTHLLVPIVRGSSLTQGTRSLSSSSDSALTDTFVRSLLLYGSLRGKPSVSSDGLYKPSSKMKGSLSLPRSEAPVYKIDTFWNVPELWPAPINKLKKHEYQRSGGDTRVPSDDYASSSTTDVQNYTTRQGSSEDSNWYNERSCYSTDDSYTHSRLHSHNLTSYDTAAPNIGIGLPVAEAEVCYNDDTDAPNTCRWLPIAEEEVCYNDDTDAPNTCRWLPIAEEEVCYNDDPAAPNTGRGLPIAEEEVRQVLLVNKWEDHSRRHTCSYGDSRNISQASTQRTVCCTPLICSSRVNDGQYNKSPGRHLHVLQRRVNQAAVAKQEMRKSKRTNRARSDKFDNYGKAVNDRELLLPFVKTEKLERKRKERHPIFYEKVEEKVFSDNAEFNDPLRNVLVQTKKVRKFHDAATSMSDREPVNVNNVLLGRRKAVSPASETESMLKTTKKKKSAAVQTESSMKDDAETYFKMCITERQAGTDDKKKPHFVLPDLKLDSENVISDGKSTPSTGEHIIKEHVSKEQPTSIDSGKVTEVLHSSSSRDDIALHIEGRQLKKLLERSRYSGPWTDGLLDDKSYTVKSDVLVVVGEKVFRAHRLMLAAYSTWFRTALKLMEKSGSNIISVPRIKSDIFKILHNWIYSKELNVIDRCIPAVYRAAHQLGMTDALELCIQLAKKQRITIQNVAPPSLPFPDRQTRSGASQPIVREINGKLEHFPRKSENTDILDAFLRLQPNAFREIVAHRDFFNLHVDTVRALLSEDCLDIRSELEVFDAAYSWLAHDWPGRIAYAQPVLKCIRFSLLSQHEIIQIAFHKKNVAAMALPVCRDLILKAFLYQLTLNIYWASLVLRFWAAYTTGDLDCLSLPMLGDKRRQNVKIRRPARLGRWAAAVRIQTAWRGWMAQQELHVKQGAASLIQASYRSYLTRIWLQECSAAAQSLKKIFLQQEKCRNIAATIIQSHFKGAWVRKHMKKLAHAALIIQKSWRGYLLRTLLKNYDDYYAKHLGDLDMLILGGLDPFRGKGSTKAGHWCYVYRFEDNKWTVVNLAPTILLYSQAALLGNSVYITGGCNSAKTNWWKDVAPVKSTWSWNLTTNRWKPEGDMRHARMHHASVSCYGRLYVLGGIDDSNTIINSVEMYDTSTKQWYEMAPMRTARMGFSALFLDGKIFACGGIGISSMRPKHATVLNEVETYLPHEDRWEEETPLLCPRCFTAALRDKYFLYIVGGVEISKDDNGNDVSGSVDKVEVYNIIKRQWKPMWKLRSPRHAAILLNYRHQLLLFGGLSTYKQRVMDTVEIYDLVDPRQTRDLIHFPKPTSGMAWVLIPTALSKKLRDYIIT